MTVSITTLQGYKRQQQRFAVCTAYDATFAHEASTAGVEVLLVGDSLGMVLQGHDSTLPVTIDDMAYHTACVRRGNQGSLIMTDMPFLSYGTLEEGLANARRLMQAGAHMLKLEGGRWLSDLIARLAEQGVPVCAHLGLTPQSVNKLGGFKVQGKQLDQAEQILGDALHLEACGADMLLLECVPTALADRVTQAVKIPVIGIGAGPGTDAQVLVLHDLLGLGRGKRPRFVKNFLQGASGIREALESYVAAVKSGSFPAEEHGFNS